MLSSATGVMRNSPNVWARVCTVAKIPTNELTENLSHKSFD